jgi:hypothetical protein
LEPPLPIEITGDLICVGPDNQRREELCWNEEIRKKHCGDFCGYTASKKWVIVGSTHNLLVTTISCRILIISNIYQHRAILKRAKS